MRRRGIFVINISLWRAMKNKQRRDKEKMRPARCGWVTVCDEIRLFAPAGIGYFYVTSMKVNERSPLELFDKRKTGGHARPCL